MTHQKAVRCVAAKSKKKTIGNKEARTLKSQRSFKFSIIRFFATCKFVCKDYSNIGLQPDLVPKHLS